MLASTCLYSLYAYSYYFLLLLHRYAMQCYRPGLESTNRVRSSINHLIWRLQVVYQTGLESADEFACPATHKCTWFLFGNLVKTWLFDIRPTSAALCTSSYWDCRSFALLYVWALIAKLRGILSLLLPLFLSRQSVLSLSNGYRSVFVRNTVAALLIIM